MHKELANAIRFLSIDAVQAANSGHPGMPMGMADIAVALWRYNLKHNPEIPIGLTEIGLSYQMVMDQCCYIAYFI